MPDNIHCPDDASGQRICFVLGILHRSGTNYIYKLLKEHPDCVAPGPITEDFLMHHSDMLKNYADSVYGKWNPNWEVEKKIGPPATLIKHMGHALGEFLKLQTKQSTASSGSPEQPTTKRERPSILLTKTPSVRGIENFFDLFPKDYLIVIVRDGRALVESGVRSFDWDYESAMRRWTTNAQAILDLKEKCQGSNQKLLIIKYENIFQNEKEELSKIFNFLDLDATLFDFDHAKSLGVIGSSDIKKTGAAVHWDTNKKSKDFNPLARFSNWDRKKHNRFNWIAGSCMSELEYEIEDTHGNQYVYTLQNKILDAVWRCKELFSKFAKLMKLMGASGRH